MAAWGEFRSTPEDVIVLTGFPIFGESRAIDTPGESTIKLDSEGEIRLILLNEALSDSSTKGRAPTTPG